MCFFFVLLMLSFNIVLYIDYLQYKEQVSSRLHAAQIESEEYLIMKENFEASILCNSITFDSLICCDVNDSVYDFSDLFKSQTNKILICRFSELDCENCINHAIETLKSKAGIETSSIAFLCSYRNSAMLSKMIEYYQLDSYKVYNTKLTITPIDEWGKPYYFIIDSNLTISDIIIPEKINNEIQELYFNNLKQKHFIAY